MFTTPILLIVWKRPLKTIRVINEIRKIEPIKLYIACDGTSGKDSNTLSKVKQTREIIDNEINWDCKIEKLYSDKNHGCKLAVSKAISWLFKYEEEGIILEDDCVPHLDFFYFSSIMLHKYRNDSRIWSISANNNQGSEKHNNASYYFSRYSHCWGWATWKRCWQYYDHEIKDWPIIKGGDILKNILDNKKQIKFWIKIFDDLYYNSKPDTWDYQWTYLCFKNSGLSIIPNINLINNIGFDEEATHTKNGFSKTNNKELDLEHSGLFPIIHPNEIVRSKSADLKIEHIIYSGYPLNQIKYLKKNLKKFLSKIKKIIKNYQF